MHEIVPNSVFWNRASLPLGLFDDAGQVAAATVFHENLLLQRKLQDVFHESAVLKFGSSSRNKGFEVVSGGARLKNSVPALY